MKFTRSWLADHLDTSASLAEICDTLTSIGLEVESVTDPAAALKPFTIAHIVEATQHPNADRLKLCKVETADGMKQVVCGAPNARTGLKICFAPIGAVIPSTGEALKKSAIRGVDSEGMCCSLRELNLGEDHGGIVEMDQSLPVGMPFAQAWGVDDPVIEINLTANRADCAGVRGIARDLAAAGLGTLKPLTDDAPVAGAYPNPVPVTIETGACPLFIGRHIRGVKNGASPDWLQKRLKAIGLRPITALVDITNFSAFDAARPLHVFDAKKLSGGIVVKLTQGGETLPALNDKTYTVPAGLIGIHDDSGLLGLGGVVGGTSTGVTEETVDVYLEIALFDPIKVAEAGRTLGIISDARYRFERGLDPEGAMVALNRATRLIQSLCGGEASEPVIAGAVPDWKRTIRFDTADTLKRGGVDLPAGRQHEYLKAVGCTVDGETVTPPSWRADIHASADLVEEVLRLAGYDKIPATPLPRTATMTQPAVDAGQKRAMTARRALAGLGLDEAVTWSFMEPAMADRFGGAKPSLTLVNPIAAELAVMRPTIVANLLAAAGRNAARGQADVALFEVGPIFRDGAPGAQDLVATVLRAGQTGPRHWAAKPRPVDAYDIKGDALSLLETLGAPAGNLQVSADAPVWYHPGRSGCLRLGASVLAQFGEIHPAILDALGIKGPVVAAEIWIERIPAPKRKGPAKPMLVLSQLQKVTRDFAFMVGRDVPADKLIKAVRAADKALITDAAVFDLYQGPNLPAGQQSVAITVTLAPTEKTLTEAEIEAVAKKIVDGVTAATGAVLR